MDWVWPVIQSPFTWGLALGLLVAGFVLKSAWTARGHFKREIARLTSEIADLQKHINTHLKITASGSERLEKELAELKTQNENLRVNLAAAQQKPGRAEARQLQAYDGAVARMREQAPGFARLVRKVLPGASASSAPAETTPLIPPGDTAKS